MSYKVQQSTTAYPLVFLMVQSADHITALTGASPTVTLSKNGGAFASPSGAVSEIANGWYKVAGNATDSGTLGPLALHATAASGDPSDCAFEVVVDDLTTSALRPTVAGRSLDVASTGEAGLDYANVNLPAGTVIALGIVDNGTLQSATGTTAVIRAGASFGANNRLIGMTIVITGGTGVGQARVITAWTTASNTVGVDGWTTQPDNTSTYTIYPTAPASTGAPPAANVLQWNSTNVATPATAGIPDVNIKNANNVSASAITTINANLGTTQPTNFTSTGGTALVKSDTVDIAGAAVNTNSAQLGVNVVNAGAVSWTSGAITSSVFAANTGDVPIRAATATAGAATTITLDAGASATNNFYNNTLLLITGGTGVGQSRFITAYNGTTKVATVATWVTNPDNTSTFAILPFDSVAGATAPTVAQIVTGIMQDATAGNYTVANSFGKGAYTGVAPGAASGLAIVGSNMGSSTSVTNPVTVGTNNDKTGYVLSTSAGIKKNTVLNAFPFVMTDSTNHNPVTGLTVTAQRSLDGGAFANCANSVSETSNGWYKIDLATTDTNGNTVAMRFTATGADTLDLSFTTMA